MKIMRWIQALPPWAPALILPLALVVLQACGRSQAAESHDSPGPEPRTDTLEVTRGDFNSRLLLTGELEAEDAIALVVPNANIWPVTLRWVAEDGAEVEEGEIVAEFDNSQLLSNLDDLQVRVLEAENELLSDGARVASELAEAEFEVEKKRSELAKAKIEAAVPIGVLAQRDYDQRQLDLKRAELQLDGAERQLETTRAAGRADIEMKKIGLAKAENALSQAESGIERLTIQAPRTGILIIQENPMEGRPYRPGDNPWPGQTLAQLPDLDTLRVTARLFDVDDERVHSGQEVEASLDAFPDLVYRGRVAEVDEMADQAGRFSLRRFFDVKIGLDRVDANLMRPGMSVKLLVEEEPLEDVLLIPRAALDWNGNEAAAIVAGGRHEKVELGPCNAFDCVVLESEETQVAEGMRLEPRIEGRPMTEEIEK